MDTKARASKIAAQFYDRDPAHPEAQLWHAMMSGQGLRRLSDTEAVSVSNELYRRWSDALAKQRGA